MARCIRDGKVAVIFSPNDRWSLMNFGKEHDDFLLHDDGLVNLIETKQFDKIPAFVEQHCPDVDFWWLENNDRISNLEISWIPEGSLFRIVPLEDGMFERVERFNPIFWKTA